MTPLLLILSTSYSPSPTHNYPENWMEFFWSQHQQLCKETPSGKGHSSRCSPKLGCPISQGPLSTSETQSEVSISSAQKGCWKHYSWDPFPIPSPKKNPVENSQEQFPQECCCWEKNKKPSVLFWYHISICILVEAWPSWVPVPPYKMFALLFLWGH